MNPRFLEHYHRELQFIREMGAEFAQRHPKIAGGLDLGGAECADPYVERLLEGFAFLTARIQLKMEAEFPRFTQHLLEMVFPHYLAPLPSMMVVQFKPDLKGGVTEQGFPLPRHTRLRSSSSIKGRARCEFLTAHELMLWPLRLVEARYLPQGEAGRYSTPGLHGVKAAMRLRLETVTDIRMQQLPLDRLPLYLHGSGETPTRLYELLLGHGLAVVVQPVGLDAPWRESLNKRSIHALGFDDQQALLPYSAPSFQGYRLLQEYFALPQRFLFVELCGLQTAIKRCDDTALEIIILLDAERKELEERVSEDNFQLYCAPAINLFPKRADRIHLTHRSTEQHLIVDKTRQRDFEVHSVTEVIGFGGGSAPEQFFRPFYSMQEEMAIDGGFAYYTVRRQPTLESSKTGPTTLKADYLGSELFIALVDAGEAPFRSDLKQLGVATLCTNRDLPMLMLTGQETADFTLDIGAQVDAVRCLAGPTDPRPAHSEGEHAWRLITHLSLNYLSLLNNDETKGATALRDLLRLYGDFGEPAVAKQIDGLLTVNGRPVVRRIPIAGPMSFGRGMEITVTFDESAFEGAGAFLLGAVLERFFCKYVSINSFTQAVVRTRERGEMMRWPVRTGTRTLM